MNSFFVSSIFILFFLFSLLGLSDSAVQVYSDRKRKIYILLFTLLTLLIGFRPENIDNDYWAYKQMFNTDTIFAEPSFLLIRYLLKNIFHLSIISLMVVYAIISLKVKERVIFEQSSYQSLSVLLFIGDILLLHECTQIRAGCAISIFLYSLKFIKSKEIQKYYLCIILAACFHVSALIAIPLYFLRVHTFNKYLWLFILFFGFFLSIMKINPISVLSLLPLPPYIMKKVMEYLELNQAANVFTIFTLMKTLMVWILIYKRKLVYEKNDFAYLWLKIEILSIFSLCFFSQNLGFALRFSEFLSGVGILLFPLLICCFREKKVTKSFLYLVSLFWLSLRIFKYKLIGF